MVARAERSGTPQQVLVGPRRPAAAPIRPPPRTVGPHRQPACPRGPGEPAPPPGPRSTHVGRESLPTPWGHVVPVLRALRPEEPPRARRSHVRGRWLPRGPGEGLELDLGDLGSEPWLPRGPGSLGQRRWWSWLRGCLPRHPPVRPLSARTVLIARENGTCSPRERYLFVVRTDGASGCLWVRVARSARQWVLGGPGAWWLWDKLRDTRSVLRGRRVPRICATRGRPGGLRAQFEVVYAELWIACHLSGGPDPCA